MTSHVEPTQLTSTQMRTHNMAGTPEAAPYSLLVMACVTTILNSVTVD